MPASDFKQIFLLLNKGNSNKCEESGGIVYCYKCDPENYLPVTITLNGDTKLKLLPKYYLDYEPSNDRCLLLFKGISSTDMDHWVIGDAVLKTLYLVFDMDNRRVGMMTNALTLGDNHEDLV